MTTLKRCILSEEDILLPFLGDTPSSEIIVGKCVSSERSTTPDYKISLSNVDSDLEVDDTLSNNTLRGKGDSSDSFKKSKKIILLSDSSSSKSTPREDQPYSKESETWSGDTVDDTESPQLMHVQLQRLKLSKIIPSLAEEIKSERENDQLERTSCQILENLIAHSIGFIEQKALPAILGIEELHKQFQMESMKSQRQISSLFIENLSLEAEITNSEQALLEKEKTSLIPQPLTSDRWSMMKTDGSTWRSDLDLKRDGSWDQQNMMATVRKWLDASNKEHNMEKEQLMDVLHTLEKRVNQLTLEMDLIECKKCIFEKKTPRIQKEHQQIREGDRPESVGWESLESRKFSQGVRSPRTIPVSNDDLLFNDYLQISQGPIKNTYKVSINSEKIVSNLTGKVSMGERLTTLCHRKEQGQLVESAASAPPTELWLNKHEYRSIKGSKTLTKNVDSVTATTKPSYQRSVGQVERAFHRKASEGEKEHRRNFVRTTSPFFEMQRLAQLDNCQKGSDIICLRTASTVI